jgi:hypothetical protein
MSNYKERKLIGKGRFVLITKDGQSIEHTSVKMRNGKMELFLLDSKTVIIAFSDIKWIKVKRVDTEKSYLLTGGLLLIIVTLILAKKGWDEFKDKDLCTGEMAAKGTSWYPRLKVLRNFRDKYLMKSRSSRFLVSLYYTCSPYLSNLMKRNKELKHTVRMGLLSMITLCSLLDRNLEKA